VKAAVGLGNPGLGYALSRHNVGFQVIDLYRELERGVGTGRRAHHAIIYRHQDLLLAKPTTCMNGSGDAVRALLAATGLHPRDVLLVHDELDLPLGRLRIVPGGGPGTHKGVRSVIDAVGTTEIPRLKVGVEIEGRTVDGASFVLERFPEEEWRRIAPVLRWAAAALAAFRRDPLAQVMTVFNRPPDGVAAG